MPAVAQESELFGTIELSKILIEGTERQVSRFASDFKEKTIRESDRGLAAKFFESSGHRSEEHTSELQSQSNLVCRLLLEKKKDQLLNVQVRIKSKRNYEQRDLARDIT